MCLQRTRWIEPSARYRRLGHEYNPHKVAHNFNRKKIQYAGAVSVVRASGGPFVISRCKSKRRSSWAFAATIIVDRLIAIAPTLIGRSSPEWMNNPAATGIATKLYAVAQIRF